MNFVQLISLVILVLALAMSPTQSTHAVDGPGAGSITLPDEQDQSTEPADKQESAATIQPESTPDDSSETLQQILEGHSLHGAAFNEGPRQSAYIMGGTGNVHFPVTTKNDDAQNFINQGVGQLHGFWYLEAERSFRHAASLDPDCAMAYWGAALATETDRKRAAGFIDQAVSRMDSVTEREKMYIQAWEKFLKGSGGKKVFSTSQSAAADDQKPDLSADERKSRAGALLHDLESIVIQYPSDIEAKALVAHRIWYNSRDGIPISSYTATESLIKEILAVEPLHPAHHYMIHLWDHRHPENALQSAARCGISAPSIAHMWHMPGHIYSRLKRYEDAVYQQEASARVDHAHMMRDRVMPDEISNFAHNNEWLIRNLIFLGRARQAQALATNMTQLPRHPKYNSLEKNGSYGYGRRRLIQVLREFQMFDETVRICRETNLLSAQESPQHYAEYLRLGGVAAVMVGQQSLQSQMEIELRKLLNDASTKASELSQRTAFLEAALDESDDRPPRPCPPEKFKIYIETPDKNLETAKNEAGKIKKLIDVCEKSLLAIEGHTQFMSGDYASAHQSLKEATGEDVSWLGEIQILAGNTKEGLDTLQQQVKRRPKEVIPLARLAFWQHSQGKLDQARETFATLRACSSSIDIDLPMFRRLGPLAESAGCRDNWLKPYSPAGDTGFRPSLASLGPAHWSSPIAPGWELNDSNGKSISSADFVGRPHIIIFFLGHGCLHCAQQIQAFAGSVKDFRKAGMEIIAISSDDHDGLATSVANFDGDLPYFALAADESKSVFKKFRAYDDFEQQPLHGTFLIDGQGKILWQDISFEPFMDHDFLLEEAQRLLFEYPSQDLQPASRSEISQKGR